MSNPVIELRDVKKSFGPVEVLKGVNLKVYAGQVTALVGDNGAGKSTLIKGLSGVQPYDSGTVVFDGLGREELLQKTLDEPSMELQATKALQSLSVRTVKSVRQKVSSLSGGQRQTVAIARSVLRNAKLVILDEPTAALGVAQTEQVLNLVQRLADSGVAVLIISHNLADVFKVCGDISVLYLGRMVTQIETTDTSQNDVVGYITGTKGVED